MLLFNQEGLVVGHLVHHRSGLLLGQLRGAGASPTYQEVPDHQCRAEISQQKLWKAAEQEEAVVEVVHLGKAELGELNVTVFPFLNISRLDPSINSLSRIFRSAGF